MKKWTGIIVCVALSSAIGGFFLGPVVLQGQIVKRLQDELYEFKDASGTIHVEIDDEDWPPQAISETARVKLTGEVDRDLMNREIDVELVELVN